MMVNGGVRVPPSRLPYFWASTRAESGGENLALTAFHSLPSAVTDFHHHQVRTPLNKARYRA
jgi:hypothetical protein